MPGNGVQISHGGGGGGAACFLNFALCKVNK